MDSDSNDVMVVELEADADDAEFSDDIPVHKRLKSSDARSGNPGVLIGKLVAWDDAGNPLVDYPSNPSECFLPARTTVPLNQAHLGREVALMLVNGDSRCSRHMPPQQLCAGLMTPHTARPKVSARPSPPKLMASDWFSPPNRKLSCSAGKRA